MALDASVYCDCFDRGRLRSTPPPGCTLAVDSTGLLVCGSDDLDAQLAFDLWYLERACEHENGIVVKHHLGNIALVTALRDVLEEHHDRFPLLLERVLYDGVHSGDFIPHTYISRLKDEVEALAGVRCQDEQMDQFMREFETQMRGLVLASLTVGKPIVF